MLHADERVSAVVNRMWPSEAEREQVLALLAEYGKAPHEREAARVRLAVLKLSEGQVDRIPELIAAANRDYRDVLLWAEYPEEGRALWTASSRLSPEQRKTLEDIRRRDREQYVSWLADGGGRPRRG